MRVVAFLALTSVGSALCRGPECAAEEVDAGSLLQVKKSNGDVSVVSSDDVQPTATKPSDIAALVALWEANGRQGTLIGWGDGDPCVGSSPEGQGNAQGFGPWKGVACVPCPDDPQYSCVSQIWQHQKNLNGTIPEAFRDLTELKWLFLSANNLTGPLPTSNWHTFPKLRYVDLSYNTINGDLPLNDLSSIPALRTLLVHDNHFDSVEYKGGGFEKLHVLDMNYNRNMIGKFPRAFAQIKKLRTLQIHDTNLTGSVPDGPWPLLQNLIISGSGGLCGPLPSPCYHESTYCDVIQDFPSCDASEDLPELIFGTPLASYHNATVRVYAAAVMQLGYKVRIVSKYIHPVLYPMFTGFGGVDSTAGCKKVGCADKCEESGLGKTSPCIDFVVDSNIPVNHATWLEPYQNQYDVMGTAFETQYITLWAPRYAGLTSISVAAKTDDAYKTIIGFKGGPEDGCNTLYCPKCGDGNLPYITGDPLAGAGFTYRSYPCPDFSGEVKKLMDAKEKFMLLTWTPQVWPAAFPELEPVDLENYTNTIKPNEGKAQIRKTSRWKFTDKAFSVLGAVYIGTEGAQMMDAWSHGYYNDPPGQLCDYYSFASACSEEAAQKWIKNNQDHGETQGIWKTFFW